MAVSRRSAPALTALAVLTVLGLGTALDAGAARAAEPTERGGHRPDPYAGAGLPLRLPDGRQIRLVRPERPDRPQRPVAPPGGGVDVGPAASPPHDTPTDPDPAPGAAGPTGPGRPADPGNGEPPTAAGGPLSDFPVPVLQPLFPSSPAVGGRGTSADPTGGSAAVPAAPDDPGQDDPGPSGSGPDPSGDDPGADGGDGSAAAADPAGPEPSAADDVSLTATARAVARATVSAANDAVAAAEAVSAADGQDPQQPWPPAAAGPPPLGPRALASPQAANVALPPAGPNGYSGTLRRRLLPLGVGLALIGAGAALLGWRLRRL